MAQASAMFHNVWRKSACDASVTPLLNSLKLEGVLSNEGATVGARLSAISKHRRTDV